MQAKSMEDERYRAAKAKVENIRVFYIHLMLFAGINILLFIINMIQSPHAIWFYWVTLFWGVGLCWHAYSVFGTEPLFGREWEEKKIKEILEKEEKR
jgi:hypothetical protein